jgi:site-specific recombinase XerD
MSTGLKIYLFVYTAKTNKKGLAPIVLRLKYQNQTEQLFTGLKIYPKNWNKDKCIVKPGEPEFKVMNVHLNDLKIKAHQQFSIMFQNENVYLREIIDHFKGKETGPILLLDLAKNYNLKLKERVGIDYKIATYKKYQITEQKLIAFIKSLGKSDIRIKDLSNEFIVDFNTFMKQYYGNDQNTTCKHLKNLKTYIKYAVSKGWLLKSPFNDFRISYKPKEKPYLSMNELLQLEKHEFNVPKLELVKDLFLFQCYTGLSFSDLMELKGINLTTGIDGNFWIIKNRLKTDVRSAIPLLPKALIILNKHNCNYVNNLSESLFKVGKIQSYNAYLKQIADFTGIQKQLSSHAGRRTFASTVALTNGISIESIAKMLGHSNSRITHQYARVSDLKIANEMDKIRKIF